MNKILISFTTYDPEKDCLLCFPYAGSGANVFRKWAQPLNGVNLLALQLPGRETRFREPRATNFESLVEQLALLINSGIQRRFSIFGHSLGGMIGFAVCQILQKKYGRFADTLFISGRCPPVYQAIKPEDFSTDFNLISFLKRSGGAPPEALANEDLLKTFLPIVRDDLILNHDSSSFNFEEVDCPIVTLSGEHDRLAPPAIMATWHNYTTEATTSYTFKGGHFFINEYPQQILDTIADTLCLADLAN